MAVIKMPLSNGASVKLNAGKDPTTLKTITRSVQIAGIKTGASDEMILNVAELLAPCLQYPVTAVEVSNKYSLERDG